MNAAQLTTKILRLEAEYADVKRKTAGHYSPTVQRGAHQRLEDIDRLLTIYRADLENAKP